MGSLSTPGGSVTGLAYERNRYYDPVAGQFTQEDPIGIAGGVNLYLFAGGDPVNFGDPFGLAPCDDPRGCPEIDYEIPELPGLTATVTQNAEGPDRDDEAALLALFVEALAIGEKTFALLAGDPGADGECDFIEDLFGCSFSQAGYSVAVVSPDLIPGGVAGRITGFAKNYRGLGHGLHRAIGRDGVGVLSRAILDAVRTPVEFVRQGGGRVKYIGEYATVVLNSAGEVVTTWARNRRGVRF